MLESKYEFCGIANFQPGPITISAIEEINRVTSMTKLLKGVLGAAPIILIFASPGTSNSAANVALTGYSITQTDWMQLAITMKNLNVIEKKRLRDIINYAQRDTHGAEKRFWNCMNSAVPKK